MHLQNYGYWQLMTGTGNCQETQLRNAPMERFWQSLRVEKTHGRALETREEARRCIFAYFEGLYNTTRTHSSINWAPPREFQWRRDARLRAESSRITIYRTASEEPRPVNRAYSHLY